MITYTTQETLSHVLTAEGASIALNGSHEARVWAAVPAKGEGEPITPKQLEEKVGGEAAKVGQGRAFKNKWIAKEGSGLVKIVSAVLPSLLCAWVFTVRTEAASIDDTTQKELREVDSTGTLKAGEKVLADLRKRKLITQKSVAAVSMFPIC